MRVLPHPGDWRLNNEFIWTAAIIALLHLIAAQ
jgi:hypothetical protein